MNQRIAIYRLEPYDNTALDKIKIYHESLGDLVEEFLPLDYKKYDKIYCSSIFSFTPKDHLLIDERWECGGTGFDIYKKLPPEIEAIKPHKNYGKCMDGCNNKCKFCVVHRKEGKARATGDLYDIWNGNEDTRELTLYCNNILQLEDHFLMLCGQARKGKFKIDWNQGLDIRLVNSDIAKELSSITHVKYHFAFDGLKIESAFRKGVAILKDHGINQSTFYTLIGFDETLEEELYRLEVLRELGQRPYIMRYKKVDPEMSDGMITKDNEVVYNAIDRWGNNQSWFASLSFKEWLCCNADNVNRYKIKFQKLGLWDLLTKGSEKKHEDGYGSGGRIL